jgi:hypothetical protein
MWKQANNLIIQRTGVGAGGEGATSFSLLKPELHQNELFLNFSLHNPK